MISVEEALARLLAPLMALPPEQVSVADAVGRVLAEDVAARRTQPPFAVSAMDGYAVRADDVAKVPASLRIVAEIPAGAGYGGTIGAGEAARIFTGAPLPAGADAIVIQERTERDGDRVTVKGGASKGRYVRRGRACLCAAGRASAFCQRATRSSCPATGWGRTRLSARTRWLSPPSSRHAA